MVEDQPGDPMPKELLHLLSSDPDPMLLGIHVLLISGDIEAGRLRGRQGVLRLSPAVTRRP